MLRRILYVIIGIVSVDLALMAVMFLQMRHDDHCDVQTRGLLVRTEDGSRWMWLEPPAHGFPNRDGAASAAGAALPPCRGVLRTELHMLEPAPT